MSLRFFLFVVVSCGLFLSSSAVQASPSPASFAGLWRTADQDGVIEIYPCQDNSYCGRFYWLKDDSAENPSRDDRNPDPDKRKQPLCGMTFMGGFAPSGEHRATGGWVYSIRHGATFSAEMNLIDEDTLELRGYMFVSWLGGSEQWTRVPASTIACPLLSLK